MHEFGAGRRTSGLRERVCLLLGVAVLSALGCTQNPVTGRSEFVLMSVEDERKIDEQGAQQVEAFLGVVDDPALNAYVDAVGQAMAKHAPHRSHEYHFAVVEMDVPNAFALPGGHIYVSRGLLILSNSEAELANVLGHEIGHVAHRHAAQRDIYSKAVGLATVLGTVGAVMGGGDGRTVAGVQTLGGGLTAAYGRSQESEADVFGQELARDVGVDPQGMSDFLRSLERSVRLEQGYSRGAGYFDTHPATRERVAAARSRATYSRWEPRLSIAQDHDDYLSRIDGITVGKPASEGVLRNGRFLHPELRISIAFPDGWPVDNQRSRVLGVSPNRDAIVMLELQGPGHDAVRAAREYEASEGLEFEAGKAVRIGGLDAYRARTEVETPAGLFDAEVLWVAHRGNIYRLSAGAARGRFNRYAGVFRGFGRSFRELRRDEEPLIDEIRVRIATVQEGEGLWGLSERTGNVWDLNRTAVMNDLVIDDVLPVGARIKVAVREPYAWQGPEGFEEPEDYERPGPGGDADGSGQVDTSEPEASSPDAQSTPAVPLERDC